MASNNTGRGKQSGKKETCKGLTVAERLDAAIAAIEAEEQRVPDGWFTLATYAEDREKPINRKTADGRIRKAIRAGLVEVRDHKLRGKCCKIYRYIEA